MKAASTSAIFICSCLILRLVLLWSWCSSKASPPWAWLPIQEWLRICSAGHPTDIWLTFFQIIRNFSSKKEVCSSKDNLRTPELPEDFLEVLLVSVKLFPRNPSSKHMKGADCPPSFPNYLQAQYYRKISVWSFYSHPTYGGPATFNASG